MTEADLIRLLSERFHGNFADETARRVRDAGAVYLLYAVATAPHPELPGPVRQKVLFRGAYVLERIYFDAPEAFMPRAESFCRVDFAAFRGQGRPFVIFGSGARKCAGVLSDAVCVEVTPSARGLARLAQQALDEGRTEDIAYFEPFYLKDFVVTTSRKKLF